MSDALESRSDVAVAAPKPRAPHRSGRWQALLLGRALRTSPLRTAIALGGVGASTLLVLVLLSAHRSLVESVGAYVGQPAIGLWVAPRGTDNLIRSSAVLPAATAHQLRSVPGVRSVSPILRAFVRAERVQPDRRNGGERSHVNLLAIGYPAPEGLAGPPRLVAGRLPGREGGVALDRAAAARLGARVGDRIRLNGVPLEVLGITAGTNLFATQFVFVPWAVAETLSGYRGQASFFVLGLAEGASPSEVGRRIASLSPAYAAFTPAAFVDNNEQEVAAGFRPLHVLISSVGLLVAAVLVALLVQGVVEDRKSDIAVLLALGARVPLVAASVQVRAVLLVCAGCALGAAASWLLRASMERWVPTVELTPAWSDVGLVLAMFCGAATVAASLPLLKLRSIDPRGGVPAMSSALRLDRVSKRRGAGARTVFALRDVSLVIEPGEVVLLEGPSGSGKTTLLTVAAGLLAADEGEVELAGTPLRGLSNAARRAHRARAVGFVFQRANLLEGLNVRENVVLAAALAGMPRDAALQQAEGLLRTLGIAELGERMPNQVSGGEEHRAAVARALVHRPAVVFADEPTGNLDSVAGRAVAESLVSLARSHAVAVLVATHDARLHAFATRRLYIADGRLQESGAP
jgi:putative ABC transport system ATP-binding protein